MISQGKQETLREMARTHEEELDTSTPTAQQECRQTEQVVSATAIIRRQMLTESEPTTDNVKGTHP